MMKLELEVKSTRWLLRWLLHLKVVVVGTGGAGQAIAFGCAQGGAQVGFSCSRPICDVVERGLHPGQNSHM